MNRFLLATVVALVWGCSAGTGAEDAGGERPDAGSTADAGDRADAGIEPDGGHDPSGRSVLVTWVDTYHFGGVDEAVPRDVSKLVVGSFADGGFSLLPVEVVDAGVGRIQPAPEGPLHYLVQLDTETYWIPEPETLWVVSGSDEIHLGRSLSERAQVERGDAGTMLDVTWSGSDGGDIKYSFPSAGVSWRWLSPDALPNADRSSLDGVPLPKAGDDVWFLEYLSRDSLRADGGTQNQTILAKTWSTNSLSIAQGQTTSVTVPLTPVTSVATYPVDVRNDEFVLEAQKADPRVTSATSTVSVDAVPDMQGGSVAVPLASSDGTVETLQVPDPFQGTWVQRALVRTGTIGGSFYMVGDVKMLNGPIRPVVGIATDVRVDGVPAAGSVVSTTPTVTWTAPELGPATYYAVRIGSGSSMVWLWTAATELRIPPGVLYPNGAFTLRVRAYHSEKDLQSRPFDYVMPTMYADTKSLLFSTW